jgi:hypothetical protein
MTQQHEKRRLQTLSPELQHSSSSGEPGAHICYPHNTTPYLSPNSAATWKRRHIRIPCFHGCLLLFPPQSQLPNPDKLLERETINDGAGLYGKANPPVHGVQEPKGATTAALAAPGHNTEAPGHNVDLVLLRAPFRRRY